MSEHNVAYDTLISFAAEELEPAKSALVAKHVATCWHCAATVARFRSIVAIRQTDDTEAPPPDMISRAQNIFFSHPVSDNALIAFADGDLDATELTRVATHVAICPTCAATVARFKIVSSIRDWDDTINVPMASIVKAQRIFTPDRPAPKTSWLSTNWNFSLRFASVALAVLIVLFAFGVGTVAAQAIPPNSALYPIKVTVQGLQVTVSNLWQAIGTIGVMATPTPAATVTPSPEQAPAPSQLVAPSPAPTATPTATRVLPTPSLAVPSPTPQATPTNLTPPGQTKTPPGQEKTPPGQDQTPPGQHKTPPGQDQTPPGQDKTPPGQDQTPPGQDKTPPGQDQTPPGQDKIPPGQDQTPPGQDKIPPGQDKKK